MGPLRLSTRAHTVRLFIMLIGSARGVAGKFPSENGLRYTGVSHLHSHQFTLVLKVMKYFGAFHGLCRRPILGGVLDSAP